MITLNDLTYLYEHQPMRFSLDVSAGERIAILGPSGAGKSTLLALIAGFLMADKGTVMLDVSIIPTRPPLSAPYLCYFKRIICSLI